MSRFRPVTTHENNLYSHAVTNLQPISLTTPIRFSTLVLYTQADMATQPQITANQQNAQSSTGPRTAEGKSAVSQNALKHGLASSFRVLPNEDQQEFDSLAESFNDEFQPDGEHETFLVEQLLHSRWKLARIQRLETALFENMMTFGSDHEIATGLLGPAGKALANLQRYAAAAERTYHKSYRELIRSRQEAQKNQARSVEATINAYMNAPMPSLKPVAVSAPKQPSANAALRL